MRIVAASEANSFPPSQFFLLFQWQSKVVALVSPSLLCSYFYIFELVFFMNMHEMFAS
jgi:hypothetical protein